MNLSAQADASSEKLRILVLEAYEHVNNDQVARYLKLAQAIDDRVRESEPGMLVHALTKSSESTSKTVFRWLEVFENAAALEAHLDSPHVVSHIEKMSDGVLCDTTDLVIYADWTDELKSSLTDKLSGAKFSFAPIESGFFMQR